MKNKLLIISSYPEKDTIHADRTVGGASYTKQLLTTIKKQYPKTKITVLAEILDSASSYTENGISVKRIWKRNNLFSLIWLLLYIVKQKESRVVVSFEAYIFGSPVLSLLFFSMLFFVKLITNVPVYVLMHQVIKDFKNLNPGITGTFLNLGKSFLYTLIKQTATTIIVFEEKLKQTLDASSSIVIPHAVGNAKNVPQKTARKKLGLMKTKKYILCFGYLAPYKGLESLVSLWPKEKNAPILILAGGINPNHAKNPRMKRYVNDLIEKTKENSNIVTTDFVPEHEIPLYFSACDAVIVPYTLFMASSGPLSLALSYSKPVILSNELSGYTQTEDIKTVLTDMNLSVTDITFKRTKKNLSDTLSKALSNKAALGTMAGKIAKQRSYTKISKQFADVLQLTK